MLRDPTNAVTFKCGVEVRFDHAFFSNPISADEINKQHESAFGSVYFTTRWLLSDDDILMMI
ncbi:hypothetical protein DESC_370045 [Desulfosarcina cetonica]|nr:hypothetical protein DESC_370045 [Desulfosarcina cetonica]